jgi:hypothetical protein
VQTYLRIVVLYNKYGQVKGPNLSKVFEGEKIYGRRKLVASSGFKRWKKEGFDCLGGETPPAPEALLLSEI